MVQQLRIEDALIGAVFVVCCGFHDYRDGMHNLHDQKEHENQT